MTGLCSSKNGSSERAALLEELKPSEKRLAKQLLHTRRREPTARSRAKLVLSLLLRRQKMAPALDRLPIRSPFQNRRLAQLLQEPELKPLQEPCQKSSLSGGSREPTGPELVFEASPAQAKNGSGS